MATPRNLGDKWGHLVGESADKARVSPCSNCPQQQEAIEQNGAPCDDHNGNAGVWHWRPVGNQSAPWKDVDCSTCQYRDTA